MMVRLVMTHEIVHAIESLVDSGRPFDADAHSSEPSLHAPAVGNPITHGQIVDISKSLAVLKNQKDGFGSGGSPSHHLDDLLRGSRVYIEPAKPKAEPTSEFKALMARLRREEEAHAYERMISPPVPAETFAQRFPGSQTAKLFPAEQADIGDSDEISYADVNRQMALIANVLISIVACSVAIWMVAKHWSTPSRLGLSMGGSIMVGVAEVAVYAGYLKRLTDAREQGKKEIEIKEIIKTWVIGSEEKPTGEEDNPVSITEIPTDAAVRRRKATRK